GRRQRLAGTAALRGLQPGRDRRRAAVALPGAPLGGHRRRRLHPRGLAQPDLAAGAGRAHPDRGPHPGMAGAPLRPGHPEDPDRLARGLLHHRGTGRGPGPSARRRTGRPGGRTPGRRRLSADREPRPDRPGPAGPEPAEPATAVPEPSADTERRLSPLTVATTTINHARSAAVPVLVALFAGDFNPWVLGGTVATAVLLV